MVNHGLDVGFHAVLEAVHWLVDGCDKERDGIDVVPAVNYLVREAGMPPDAQVGGCTCACSQVVSGSKVLFLLLHRSWPYTSRRSRKNFPLSSGFQIMITPHRRGYQHLTARFPKSSPRDGSTASLFDIPVAPKLLLLLSNQALGKLVQGV